jgi:tRNA-specific adenosine deaminase 3
MRDVVPDEELLISYGTGRMWWEDENRNGKDHTCEDLESEDDSNSRLEDELLMLGQLGLVHDDQESRHAKRRDERRRYNASFTPTPPSATPAPIVAPKLIGPDAAPLWRITAAVDPNTTPLELMTVWAVEIDPRKSSNFMQFSRSVSRRLRAAEEGGDGQEHIRRAPERTREEEEEEEDLDEEDEEDEEEDDSEDEDESMKHLRLFHRTQNVQGLSALVCRVEDVPSLDKVKSLLKSADVVYDGTEPIPYQVLVPKHPAPSRERLQEWKAFWPVAVKHGKSAVDFSGKPSPVPNNPTAYPISSTPGAVDRAADARLWTKEATEWAVSNFKKCLALAKRAKEQGELPIGVHVTPTFSDLQSSSLLGPDGHSWIEVDAWDTRRSERNPIKHGVTNAIRDVAKLRSDRDRERLVLLSAKVAASNRDSLADPQVNRQAAKVVEETSHGRVANSGQDYLLNNLILFTTHEPCLLCCMSLVHSRVRAIYFIQPSPGAGGCCGSGLKEELRCTFAQDGGPYAVQEQAGLNHHFDVWKWVGDPKDLGEENLGDLLDVNNLDA